MEHILSSVRRRLKDGPCDTLTLAHLLEVDPKFLSAFLWQSGDLRIDFCPHKSQQNNIVWELTEMKLSLDEKKKAAREIADDFENEDNLNLEGASDLANLIREIVDEEKEKWNKGKKKATLAIADEFENEENLIREIVDEEKEKWNKGKKKAALAIADEFENEDNVNFEEASDLAELIRKIAEKENW